MGIKFLKQMSSARLASLTFGQNETWLSSAWSDVLVRLGLENRDDECSDLAKRQQHAISHQIMETDMSACAYKGYDLRKCLEIFDPKCIAMRENTVQAASQKDPFIRHILDNEVGNEQGTSNQSHEYIQRWINVLQARSPTSECDARALK